MPEETQIRLDGLVISWVPGEIDAQSALKQMGEHLADTIHEVEDLSSLMDDVGLIAYQLGAPEERPIVFRFSLA
jgi:hypothetical protein